MIKIKTVIDQILKPKGRYAFIVSIPKKGKLLDVGCGDQSAKIIKTIRPDINCTGIDVSTFTSTKNYQQHLDEFIVVEPENFHTKIAEWSEKFDAITSIHNLEHCNDYLQTTQAMIKALKTGGKIYISFPSEDSIHFPSRYGTLNFYDDKTHQTTIPYQEFISVLKKHGLKILFATKKYQPTIPFLIGLLCEPFCHLLNKQAPAGGTWAFYGFETVIIAEKN